LVGHLNLRKMVLILCDIKLGFVRIEVVCDVGIGDGDLGVDLFVKELVLRKIATDVAAKLLEGEV